MVANSKLMKKRENVKVAKRVKCLGERISALPPCPKDEREKYPPFEGEVGEVVYFGENQFIF